VVSLLLLLACQPAAPVASNKAEIPEMSATDLYTRASLDIRGVRPTEAELDALDADPSALDAMLDDLLQDPRFPDRIVDLYAEIYLTRADSFPVNTIGIDVRDETAFVSSLGQEPLRLLAEIAAEDLPYTDLVTADWTMVDENLAEVYQTDYPEDGEGWQKVSYTDDRPAAGVLGTNGLWWRYVSTDSNANRKRANTLSRLLLCDDYLTRPIEFDRNVNLLDEGEVQDALNNNPGCVNCHSSLDPLASYFFGFYWYNYTSAAEARVYHPERERLWSSFTGRSPAYYGEPGYSLHDLGVSVASDPRFATCAVQQALQLMLRRDLSLDDEERSNVVRNAFIEGGLTVRALYRAILDDDAYRAGETDDADAVPRKLATVDLLATEVEDLTGFRWTYSDYDMLRSDYVGLRTLAGGADGYTVTKTATSPTTTTVLVQEALAEAAASYAVDHESAQDPADRRLFTEIAFSETPDSGRDAMVAQIQKLHRRVFGTKIDADGEEVAANLALWSDLYAVEGSTTAAWSGLLSVLLRDPDLVLY